MVSMAGTRRTYAPWLGRLWVAAATACAAYGIFLVVTAVRLPAGFELTGQPAVKALMALLLAAAALAHPVIVAGFFFRGIPSDQSATPAL
jgi:hypothetical protein